MDLISESKLSFANISNRVSAFLKTTTQIEFSFWLVNETVGGLSAVKMSSEGVLPQIKT